MFISLKHALIAQKTKFFILFTSQINIEWIKASHVDMDVSHIKEYLIVFWKFFGVLVAAQTTKKISS
jgi:hypothetical protein